MKKTVYAKKMSPYCMLLNIVKKTFPLEHIFNHTD